MPSKEKVHRGCVNTPVLRQRAKCVRVVPIFVFLAEGENNGQGVVGDGFVEQAVEVQALQVLLLAHKPPQGRCPTLRQNLRSIPLQITIRNFTIHCVFDINCTPGSTACPARRYPPLVKTWHPQWPHSSALLGRRGKLDMEE